MTVKGKARNPLLLKTFLVGVVVLAFYSGRYVAEIEIPSWERVVSKVVEIKMRLEKKEVAKKAPQSLSAEGLAALVTPDEGYEVEIKWGDLGKKIVSSGAVDLTKFTDIYTEAGNEEELKYLTETKDGNIAVNSKNAYFWVNTLWALGLVQKSDVLDKGLMMKDGIKGAANYASTGGWTLGSKPAMTLYSSSKLIELTAEQESKVAEITGNIYRPCCDNSAAFPDCNHGMAILGLVELMVSQDKGDEEIYQAALAFNSYWFPQTYMDLAYYFKTKEGLDWEKVEAKRALSKQFSSASGYIKTKKLIPDAPTAPINGGSCGA